MANCQPAVAGRAVDFLAAFARETKDDFSFEVCQRYVKQALEENESLHLAAHALQAAILARQPQWLANQDRYWKKLLKEFPDAEKVSDENRLICNLTAIWTREVLEYYGWHEQKKRFLQPLYQCARRWPEFEVQFIPLANCVMVSRQEASILGNGNTKLKCIGFHHQTKIFGYARPLLIRDVELLARWSKGGEIVAYRGERFPKQPNEAMLDHVTEWAEDTNGSVVIDGMSLQDRGMYHKAYNVIFDKYGMIIHNHKEHAAQRLARKRPIAENAEAVEEATQGGSQFQTPASKKTKVDLATQYPSPSISPLSSGLSSPIYFTDEEDESELDEISSHLAFSPGSDQAEVNEITSNGLSDNDEVGDTSCDHFMSSTDEPGTTCARIESTVQDLAVQLPWPVSFHGHQLVPVQTEHIPQFQNTFPDPTVVPQSEQTTFAESCSSGHDVQSIPLPDRPRYFEPKGQLRYGSIPSAQARGHLDNTSVPEQLPDGPFSHALSPEDCENSRNYSISYSDHHVPDRILQSPSGRPQAHRPRLVDEGFHPLCNSSFLDETPLLFVPATTHSPVQVPSSAGSSIFEQWIQSPLPPSNSSKNASALATSAQVENIAENIEETGKVLRMKLHDFLGFLLQRNTTQIEVQMDCSNLSTSLTSVDINEGSTLGLQGRLELTPGLSEALQEYMLSKSSP